MRINFYMLTRSSTHLHANIYGRSGRYKFPPKLESILLAFVSVELLGHNTLPLTLNLDMLYMEIVFYFLFFSVKN